MNQEYVNTRNIINKIMVPFVLALSATVSSLKLGDSVVLLINILFLLYVFIRPANEYILYIVMTIPSTRLMEVFGVSVAVWICCIYVIKALFTNSFKIEKNLFTLLAVYMVFMSNNIFRYSSIMYGFVQPIKMVVVFLFLYWYSKDDRALIHNESGLKSIFIFWMVGIAAALLPVAFTANAIGRVSALNNDSNIIAVEAVFLFASASVIFMKKRKVMQFFEYAVITVFAALTCLLCGSRNGLMLFALSFILIVLLNMRKETLGRNIAFILLAIVVAGVALNNNAVQLYIQNFMNRLELLETTGDVSNGRFDLWKQYINTFKENPSVWWLGMGSYTYYGITYMAHNMIIEDIATYGIIGMAILVLLYITIFRNEIQFIAGNIKMKMRMFYMLPFCIPLLGGMTLHSMTNQPNTMMLFLGIALIAVSIRKEDIIYE